MPRGLFLDNVLAFAKVELAAECDYLAEAAHQREFAALLADDPDVHVPAVVDTLCTRTVLVTTLARGTHIDAAAATLPQHTRDRLARILLRLTLRELFEFRSVRRRPLYFSSLPCCQTLRDSCAGKRAVVRGDGFRI
jgi:aarF domain-containing kinase